jgi:ElaA protein
MTNMQPTPEGKKAPGPFLPLRWAWYRWSEMTPDVLYAALRLRSAIFVVEQNCVFPDMDGRDPACEHLCGWNDDGELLAYLRLVPPGVRTREVSLGRVVVAGTARGRGLGRAVMLEGLKGCGARFPGAPVKVSAQHHLEKFYNGLGFRTVSAPYDEDGILHVDMIRG